MTDWFKVITGIEEMAIPEATEKHLMHCTSCKSVMYKDKCVNNNCKYFNK